MYLASMLEIALARNLRQKALVGPSSFSSSTIVEGGRVTGGSSVEQGNSSYLYRCPRERSYRCLIVLHESRSMNALPRFHILHDEQSQILLSLLQSLMASKRMRIFGVSGRTYRTESSNLRVDKFRGWREMYIGWDDSLEVSCER